mmetsp:Transcript_66747/g.199409  ORF Transcript_66747/g.199409 Transcript_66747/m.199409 type:complete len:227 (-) Transcript_66747:500-1180(-)
MSATRQVLGRSSRVTVVDLSRRSSFEIGSPARGVRAPPAAEVRPDKRVRAIPAHRRLHLPLLRRRQVLAAHGVHVLGVEDHAAFLELQRLAVLPAQLGKRRVGVERASAPHASSRSSGRRPRRAHIRRAVCSGRRSASPGRPVLGPVARQGVGHGVDRGRVADIGLGVGLEDSLDDCRFLLPLGVHRFGFQVGHRRSPRCRRAASSRSASSSRRRHGRQPRLCRGQ